MASRKDFVIKYDNDNYYLDSEDLLNEIKKAQIRRGYIPDQDDKPNDMSQKDFDNLVYDICKKYGYQCKLMSEGDVKISII